MCIQMYSELYIYIYYNYILKTTFKNWGNVVIREFSAESSSRDIQFQRSYLEIHSDVKIWPMLFTNAGHQSHNSQRLEYFKYIQ